MVTLIKIFNLGLLLFVISCGKNQEQVVQAEYVDRGLAPFLRSLTQINEQVPFLINDIGDISEIDLSMDDKRPIVMMFASIFCEPCQKEHKHIGEILPIEENKRKVRFYSFIISYDIFDEWDKEDVLAWKKKFHVSWPLGTDFDKVLFKKYCAGTQTPCTVTFVPKQGAKSKTGEMPIEELVSIVGEFRKDKI